MTMDKNRMQGEGNKEADRRYRKGVKETVDATTEEERERNARNLSGKDREAAEQAEAEGKSKART
jgi:hypothetical protein